MPKTVSVSTFRSDPMFPSLERAVLAILATGKVVAPVDVMVRIGWLFQTDLEDWRRGRVPYLERVTRCNLTKLGRFLRILGFYCHDLNLSGSQTVYMRHGKGPRTSLRFTKTGEARIEAAYSRHFVWPGKIPFHLPGQGGRAESGRPGTGSQEGDEGEELLPAVR